MCSVMMKAVTWTRDSHGLFDYESTDVLKKVITTHQVRFLIRKNATGEVELLSEKELAACNKQEIAVLFKVTPLDDASGTNFEVENCSTTSIYEESNDKLWLIIRSLKKNDVKEVAKI